MKELLIISLFTVNILYAQGRNGTGLEFKINDEWFLKYGSKGLQVGDKMPDILLGTTINNTTGKKRISDFRGKLVILDFWDTRCTSCMEAFPKMEALQKKFGNLIQILLVNTTETKEEITARLVNERYLSRFKLPSLPSIVSSKSYSGSADYLEHPQPFAKLFPTYGVPHHVWIDGEGVIVLRGGGENTYAKKIEDFLADKPIYSLNNTSTVPSLSRDRKTPYYRVLGGLKATMVSYGSFITPYNNEVEGAYGYSNSLIDSMRQIRFTDSINWNLLNIYKDCFSKINDWGRQILFRHIIYTEAQTNDIDFVVFPTNIDTLQFIGNDKIFNRQLTNEEFIRSKYCYSQIVPWNVSETQQGQFMLEDLNRYFGILYGVIGTLEKRKMPCFILKRTSNVDKLSASTKPRDFFIDTVVTSNGKIERVYHWPLESFFVDVLARNKLLNEFMIQNKKEGKAYMLVNETGWASDKRITIALPSEGITSLEDFRKILKPYDLDIEEGVREADFIVFKKVN
jgi:thiol-disulfide isomerase/thioredoxin